MSRRRTARLTGRGAALAGGVLLAGCGVMPDPVTEQGESVLRLWSPAVVVALVVGSLVWGLIITSVIRYRRRGDTLPPQLAEHIPIEIAYTVVPIIIVVALFAAGTFTLRSVERKVDRPDVSVRVEGFQWSWQFTYSGSDVVVSGDGAGTRGPELVLPADRTTRLDLVSDDVNHSFWVPRFLSKRDLIPGVDNEVDVTPTEQGTFVGRCAEFCGLDHWRMSFVVRIVSPDEFERWLADQPTAPGGETGGDDLVDEGEGGG